MTYPLIRVEVTQPDDKGECKVEVHLLRSVDTRGEGDNATTGATYEHVQVGSVKLGSFDAS